MPVALTSLQEEAASFKARKRTLRGNEIFNIENSATRGARILAELATLMKNKA
ncbi:hypothetical protein OAJ77_06660 [Rhodospirillales bacterium]|nr:hypothetical protein [Rhodospirillales bacterium]